MESYNESVVSKIKEYVEYVLSRVTADDAKGRVLNLVKVDVIDEGNYDLGELINSGRTYSMVLTFTVVCNEPSGKHTTFTQQIEVPKMENGLFIIEGKQRVTINILGNDGQCRNYGNNIVFGNGISVSWKYPKGHSGVFEPRFFTVHTYDLDANQIDFELSAENLITYKDFIGLSEEQMMKLKIKLDVDEVPDHVTIGLVEGMYEMGPDSYKDLIIDKRITTINDDFFRCIMRPQNRSKVISHVKRFFYYGDDVNFSALQNIIVGYFRRASETKCIEIPSSINPLIYDTLKSKLKVPEHVVYNNTFTDLIDTPNTPENNNVNIINEFNVCTSIEDGVIYYLCYDFKTGNKLKLKYLDYLNRKVLKCDYYDYDKKEIKSAPEYVYKLRLKEYKVKSIKELMDAGIELIEPSPDERLSLTTRRIPLVNMSDSVRVAMGAAMIKQSIQSEGCEPRLVSSGNDREDIINSANLVKAPVSGKVIDVTPDNVVVEDEFSGMPVLVSVPKTIVSINKVTTTYRPIVKVGDKIQKDQILITPSIMDVDSYNTGINARAVYMSYLGFTYEDGVVISESYANKACHYTSYDIIIPLHRSDHIRRIAKIGQKVMSGEILVDMTSKSPIAKSLYRAVEKGKVDTAFQLIDIRNRKNGTPTPNNIAEGYITDIKILKSDDYEQLPPTTLEQIEDWEKNKVAQEEMRLPSEYVHLEALSSYDYAPGEVAVIMIRLIARCPMQIGDKSSNSWGSKGIISLVLPDELMPRLDLDGMGNGPAFDIIMNPGAPTARKNPSQIFECALGKCIEKCYNNCLDLVEKGNIQEAKESTEMMYGDKFMKMSGEEFMTQLKKITNFRVNVGCFSKISYDTLLSWMNKLGVEEKQRIYCPDVVIYQDNDFEDSSNKRGRKGCSPEYAKAHGIQGKLYELGFVEEPVLTGISYMYKLYHSAAFSGKVTPQLVRKGEPLMRKGNYRIGGQSISEMELWALMSYGATRVVTENNPEIEREERVLLNHLFLTGFMLTDELGLPYGSELRKKIHQLKNKQ